MKLKLAIISKSFPLLLAGILPLVLAACAAPAPAPQTQASVSDLLNRPGEKALLSGINQYENAQYADAEKSLTDSLAKGLAMKKDAVLAYKYLAFIYCTTSRMDACKKSFRSARANDPAFVLSKSESGHPLWGPAYRQVMAE